MGDRPAPLAPKPEWLEPYKPDPLHLDHDILVRAWLEDRDLTDAELRRLGITRAVEQRRSPVGVELRALPWWKRGLFRLLTGYPRDTRADDGAAD